MIFIFFHRSSHFSSIHKQALEEHDLHSAKIAVGQVVKNMRTMFNEKDAGEDIKLSITMKLSTLIAILRVGDGDLTEEQHVEIAVKWVTLLLTGT